jgi:hypothetical protein
MSTSGSILDFAFGYCNLLKTVTIDNGITKIGLGSFYRSGLISVEIPVSVVLIDQYAFADSTSLISLALMGNSPLVVSSYAFANTALPCIFASRTSFTSYSSSFPTATLCVSFSLLILFII